MTTSININASAAANAEGEIERERERQLGHLLLLCVATQASSNILYQNKV